MQAVTTVVLVAVTIWYVTINKKMLKLGIEPAIELYIDIASQTLAIENYGFDDVERILFDKAFFFGAGSESGHFWELKVLKAGHKETRSIKTEAKLLAHNLRFNPTWPDHAVMVFRATYFRKPDQRSFAKTTRIILATTPEGYQLFDPIVGPSVFGDIFKNEQTFPEMMTHGGVPLAHFDKDGNPF